MFTDNSIQGIDVPDDSPFIRALVVKLVDLDKNRINKTDELVIRKAVFGLLEVVAELERRLIAIEGPAAHREWSERLGLVATALSPDQVRLGE